MGSRILLPVIAVVLVIAGVGFWQFSGDAASTAATPVAVVPAEDASTNTPAKVATPDAKPSDSKSQRKEAAQSTPSKPEAMAKAKAADTPQVAGRVIDKLGNPVVGAQVGLDALSRFGFDRANLDTGQNESSITGADGRFAVEVAGTGVRSLAVTASGFAPLAPREVRLPATGQLDLGDLVVSQGAILSGHVYDAVGRPVAGAAIHNDHSMSGGMMFTTSGRMFDVQGALAVTVADGSFRIDSLACGPWKFNVTSADYPNLSVEGQADVPGREVSGLEFQFEPAGAISGRIVGLPEGKDEPLVVRAREVSPRGGNMMGFSPAGAREIECSADGYFEIRGLKANMSYELQARIPRGSRMGMSIFGGGIRSDVTRARAGDSGVELLYSRGGSISFKVIDEATGEPVTAMVVSSGVQFLMPVRGEDGRVKREFLEGIVEVPGIYPRRNKKTIDLEITATGYYSKTFEDIEFLAGEDLGLGEIRLGSAPVLVVNVSDAKSGVPVTGARVSLRPAPRNVDQVEGRFEMDISIGDDGPGGGALFGNRQTSETDEFGVATLNSIEGQDCVLRVESDGHAPYEFTPLFLPEGKRIERDVVLYQGGTVNVSVFDPNGSPMTDVKVEHRSPNSEGGVMRFGGGRGEKGRTDSEGLVKFAHLEAGVHSFRIQDSNSGPGAGFMAGGEAVIMMSGGGGGGNKEAWGDIKVSEGSAGALRLEASPSGLLEGKVLEGGLPLAGATLKLKKASEGQDQGVPDMAAMFGGGGPSARSDGDGYYSFDDVKPGKYTLEITHPTRVLPAERDLEIRDRGGDVHMNFNVDLTITIVEGRIVDGDGKPVSGVEVRAERSTPGRAVRMEFIMMDDNDGAASMSVGGEEDGRTRTDADGFYSLRGVPANAEIVIVADGAYFEETRSEPVTVGEDSVRGGVDIVLAAAGKIEVFVVDAEGNPSGMCMVTAEFQGDEDVDDARGMVGPSGKTTLTGLRPGLWKLMVQGFANGMGQPVDTGEAIDVAAGQTANSTIDAP
ncbi:MAG: protocatechuate 3,4-dioxygenase beta subunit [Planctomycetota bacterium]|jgi:protocatechuate 3,4-dioxygenase beta subunit